MSRVPVTLSVGPPAPADPAGLLAEAARAAKCAACGCAHEASAALAALPAAAPPRLRDAARRLAASLASQRYPCLGCAVCWPAEALSLVQEAGLIGEGAACPATPVKPRPGWPPLPGDYTVLRYAAPSRSARWATARWPPRSPPKPARRLCLLGRRPPRTWASN